MKNIFLIIFYYLSECVGIIKAPSKNTPLLHYLNLNYRKAYMQKLLNMPNVFILNVTVIKCIPNVTEYNFFCEWFQCLIVLFFSFSEKSSPLIFVLKKLSSKKKKLLQNNKFLLDFFIIQVLNNQKNFDTIVIKHK